MKNEVIAISKEENQQQWEVRISEQRESGLTQAKWCEENSVNIHNFRYWKRRINEYGGEAKSESGFIEIKAANSILDGSIKITIGPATVEVADSTNLDLLNDVVKVLMHYA